jgi:hypothetical protein
LLSVSYREEPGCTGFYGNIIASANGKRRTVGKKSSNTPLGKPYGN